MINYIILMEAKAFQKNVYHTIHFYKKGEGNDIPRFFPTANNFSETMADLYAQNFISKESFTLDEVILLDVAEITVFFFDESGTYKRTGIMRRIAS